MKDKYFLDTNILVYALLDPGEKSERALQLLPRAIISVQVLNELANVARKKAGLSWSETADLTKAVAKLATVESLTLDIHLAGIELSSKLALNVYSSMIVAAAISARCETLYTEDMQHGQSIDSIMICNPFR
jgi:predicted nucleic acid-binding protein